MTDHDKIADLERKLVDAEREWAGWQRNKNGRVKALMAEKLVDDLRAEIALRRSAV